MCSEAVPSDYLHTHTGTVMLLAVAAICVDLVLMLVWQLSAPMHYELKLLKESITPKDELLVCA
ncbi:MAG: hypothetical protein MHM6MM_004777 [Cercozoa sp. M6MM]